MGDSELTDYADVMCIYETWLTTAPDSLPVYLDDYNSTWANATKEHNVGWASGGLATFSRNSLASRVLHVGRYWIFTEIINRIAMIIGNIYLKPSLDIEPVLEYPFRLSWKT